MLQCSAFTFAADIISSSILVSKEAFFLPWLLTTNPLSLLAANFSAMCYDYSIFSHFFHICLPYNTTVRLLAESISNSAGLGFNGYDEQGLPRWDLVKAIDIKGFEMGVNCKEQTNAWNINTQKWLKRSVSFHKNAHLNSIA